ncbi:hypothetical protein [Pseudomonas sp. 8O]|uniref:hypothetical protein n=1 Tax=Pseudomonas sp. 8O TaxID=2653165 RepID=UPI00135AAB76|nr:hypothetical protein [Pseudomonas sp. 8O]
MKIPFSFKFDSGTANFTKLGLYYGANALGALSEIMSITTHAILHDEVKDHTTAVRGFSVDFKNSHTGSFVQKFEIELTSEETVRTMNYLGVDSYVELLAIHLALPLGSPMALETVSAKRWFRSYMNNGEELLARLHNPLKNLHKPVYGQGYQMVLSKARTPLVGFNERTHDYLTTSITSDHRENIQMAVSRFNARTGTGRFILDNEADSVSFSPFRGVIAQNAKRKLADSLRDLANDQFTAVTAEVTRVTSRDGRIKHYYLHSVT